VGSSERAVVTTLLAQLRSLLLFGEQQGGVGGSGRGASSSRSLPGPDLSVNVRKKIAAFLMPKPSAPAVWPANGVRVMNGRWRGPRGVATTFHT